MALGLPLQSNVTFNSSANIAPSFHVGPRTYSAAGFVPHPLQLSGFAQTVRGLLFGGATTQPVRTPVAGADATAPGGVSSLIAWPHPYTINGQQPR